MQHNSSLCRHELFAVCKWILANKLPAERSTSGPACCRGLAWLSQKAAAAATCVDEVHRKCKAVGVQVGPVMLLLAFLLLWAAAARSGKRRIAKAPFKLFPHQPLLVRWQLQSSLSSGLYLTRRCWMSISMIYTRMNCGPRLQRSMMDRRWTTRTCQALQNHTRWRKVGGAFVVHRHRLSQLIGVFCSLRPRSKWVLQVETGSDGHHPAHHSAGQSEPGLLHVCLEGRSHLLRAAEGRFCVK